MQNLLHDFARLSMGWWPHNATLPVQHLSVLCYKEMNREQIENCVHVTNAA